ncbi:dehydrogenase [Gordonibacter sp. 28C]|uniref:molybdopterin-dependent oxidoreductase n=1 Tax=Gordonibacter sp. 28C TaxID=2078569 RepID=UPI000DF786A2|nr:molybdopterin-dependent oxidoreductase [Gordonibacter sp. 28C]RDB60526.1 dehydrogenase [Gordonibacter sp. 28C]
MGKTADKTVYKTLGWCGFGVGAIAGAVDVKDGRVARIRPLHLDDAYSEDQIKPWKIEARGTTFESGLVTSIPPLAVGYKKRTYSKNRVPYPLKRVDWDPSGERHVENRGISGYERISWDEAAQICADEIRRIVDTYGPSAVYCQGDGHGETKNVGGTHGANTRLMDLLGGYTLQGRQPDSWEGWYWGAKHAWGQDPLGKQSQGRNLLKDIAENTECMLYWGCDPETTTWGWSGQMPSRLCYWFSDLGIKNIYICPDLNYGAAVHADKWIPVRPNCDAALQLAIAYVWITEGLFDADYVDTHAIGYDNFAWYVTGGEDDVPKTPKWAEEKCGVPARQIKALARYWAKHNTSIAHCNGGGYIRSCFAHEPARLEVCLLTMQALGHPGRNQFSFVEWGMFGMPETIACPAPAYPVYVGGSYTGHLPGTGFRWFIPQTLLPDAILLPEGEKLTWNGHVASGLPRQDQYDQYSYPAEDGSRIHMIWSDTPCWSTCWNGGNRYQDALRHESIEFMLVNHPWIENDTLFADIILPSSTKLEQDDIATSTMCGYNDMVVNEARAIDPVGEARTDPECVLAIAEKLGLADQLVSAWCGMDGSLDAPFDPAKDTPDVRMAKMSHQAVVAAGITEPSMDVLKQIGWVGGGMEEHQSYEDFLEKGYHVVPTSDDWESLPAGLIEFYEDPEGHPLDTPSGKVEMYSTSIADHWPDDPERPPVPHWIEESPAHHERVTSDRAKDYPYLLVSNHPRWRIHANHDDVTWLREIETCKVVGPDGYAYEPIWVHPSDAEKLGLADGDVAKLYNERGAVLGGVRVSERIMPGSLYQDHGARVDVIERGTGGLERGGANNLICPGATTSQNAPGEVTNSFLVGCEKVDVSELAEEFPEAFSRAYDAATGLTAETYLVKEA